MTDAKLGNIIRPGTKGDVVLLGFPHDEGVAVNGGRSGARHGPERFRFWISQYGTVENPCAEVDLTNLSVADAGDVSADLSLEKAHAELTARTGEILQSGSIPFVIGGGNDQSYPNASALLTAAGRRGNKLPTAASRRGNKLPTPKPEQPIGVINIDAHLDVRPLKDGRAHSGSSFRQLLEDSRFSGNHFIEFAAQGSQCSREHAQYILDRNGRILWLDEVQGKNPVSESFITALGNLAWECPSIFVSFDLDSVAGRDAPGVSCPGIMGLNTEEATAIAYQAGLHPAVALFDLSEYNPDIEEERTGRLAAAIFYFFCMGTAKRLSGSPS